MHLKLFELRDRATFIPIFAYLCRPDADAVPWNREAERYLLARAGFNLHSNDDHVIIGRLECENPSVSECTYDVHSHHSPARTFMHAHHYIEQHWNELETGAVIDVEFILGETKAPKVTERLQYPES